MSWLHYLLEANIYLGVFYLCYCLLLNKETHYTFGRLYLLFSCVAAFVLPLTQLSTLKEPVEQITVESVAYIPHVAHSLAAKGTVAAPQTHLTIGDVLMYGYLAGALITLIIFCFRLYRLLVLTLKSSATKADRYKLVQLTDDDTAFSFFNYLFIGTNVPQPKTIIAHELVHIRQKHSADIIFIELLKVLSWFNPLIYLLQRSLRTLHEYIADEQTAAQEQDALTYSSFLLHNAYGLQGAPIAHSFFNYNLLKKRIIMLNQKRSGNLARLKYLLAIPLCGGMVCASTLVFSKDYAYFDIGPKRSAVTDDRAIAGLPATTASDTSLALRPPTKFGAGYSLLENDYLIDKTQPYITVTITDTNGGEKTYNSTDATAEERKMLKDKYGFEFNKDQMMAFLKAASKSDKAFTTNADVPPPPPPVMIKDPYLQLSEYVSQHVKYPNTAINDKTKVSLIANFTLGSNGRISNISITGSNDERFINALKEGLEHFEYLIKDAPGNKKLGVTFFMLGQESPAIDETAKNSPEFIGESGVVGMTNQQRKALLAPPPPPRAPKKIGRKAPKVIQIAPPAVEPKYSGSATPPPPPPPPAKASRSIKPVKIKLAPAAPVVSKLRPISIKLSPAAAELQNVKIDLDTMTVNTSIKNAIKTEVKQARIATVQKIKLNPVTEVHIDTLKLQLKKDK